MWAWYIPSYFYLPSAFLDMGPISKMGPVYMGPISVKAPSALPHPLGGVLEFTCVETEVGIGIHQLIAFFSLNGL